VKKPKFIPEFQDIPTQRQKMPELPVEERRLNFKEVELGFTEEMALKEAARCLSCRRCIGCGLCLAECDPGAVVYDQQTESISIEADGLIYTSDGKTYNPDLDLTLGYATCSDVITSYEFERLISPTGPFGGYLLRPSDGEIPRSIAFVQCVGSRNEAIGADFCSTTCCRRSLLQAKRAHQRDDVKVTVFHKGLRPIGKDSELLLAELEASDWIEFVEAEVHEITENGKGSVKVTFGRDKSQAEFDLVVLAVGVRADRDFRRFARAAGRDLNRFGFVQNSLKDLLDDVGAIRFAGAVCGPVTAHTAVIQAKAVSSSGFSDVARPEPRSLTGDKVLVYGCRYGLKLGGVSEKVLEQLGSNGFEQRGTYSYLCHKEGREALSAGIAHASHIVILGCHSGKYETFFEDLLNLERGSVTLISAQDLNGDIARTIKQAMESARLEPAVRRKPPAVCIVGSGMAGLAASRMLLRNGITVHLVEGDSEIGIGFKRIALAEGVEAETVDEYIRSVKDDENAKIHVNSRIKCLKKGNQGYVISLDSDGGQWDIECGAVLIATGSGRYIPEEFGYGTNPNIMTQDEFADRMSTNGINAKRVLMVQCVGARDDQHRYCSRFCCRQVLENALRYKEVVEDAQITIVHKGLRLFGFEEILLGEAIERGVELIQVKAKPRIYGENPLKVALESTEGNVELEADVIVLSAAHAHGEMHKDLATSLGVEIDDLGFINTSPDPLEPFDTSVEGVLACGLARQPMTAEEAFVEGLAAAGTICRRLMTRCEDEAD